MAKFKLARKVEKLEAVPEGYRGAYVERDGAYELDLEKLEAIEFDDKAELEGALKREREERKQAKADLEKYKGIDPEKAREAQRRLDELDEKNLIEKGEVEELKKRWQAEWDQEKEELKQQLSERDGQLTKFKLTDKVRAAALAAGVIPDDVDDVLLLTQNRFRLGDKDEILVLDKDGVESRSDLTKFFGEEFKAQKPKFYGASGAGGSGAPAGGTGGGGGGAKTVKRADFEKMAPADQLAHAKGGGTVVD